MCGRYASYLPPEAIARLFGTVNPLPNLRPTWNLAPTNDAPVVRLAANGERHLDTAKPESFQAEFSHGLQDFRSIRKLVRRPMDKKHPPAKAGYRRCPSGAASAPAKRARRVAIRPRYGSLR